jgi:hypothetical protein
MICEARDFLIAIGYDFRHLQDRARCENHRQTDRLEYSLCHYSAVIVVS